MSGLKRLQMTVQYRNDDVVGLDHTMWMDRGGGGGKDDLEQKQK